MSRRLVLVAPNFPEARYSLTQGRLFTSSPKTNVEKNKKSKLNSVTNDQCPSWLRHITHRVVTWGFQPCWVAWLFGCNGWGVRQDACHEGLLRVLNSTFWPNFFFWLRRAPHTPNCLNAILLIVVYHVVPCCERMRFSNCDVTKKDRNAFRNRCNTPPTAGKTKHTRAHAHHPSSTRPPPKESICCPPFTKRTHVDDSYEMNNPAARVPTKRQTAMRSCTCALNAPSTIFPRSQVLGDV